MNISVITQTDGKLIVIDNKTKRFVITDSETLSDAIERGTIDNKDSVKYYDKMIDGLIINDTEYAYYGIEYAGHYIAICIYIGEGKNVVYGKFLRYIGRTRVYMYNTYNKKYRYNNSLHRRCV